MCLGMEERRRLLDDTTGGSHRRNRNPGGDCSFTCCGAGGGAAGSSRRRRTQRLDVVDRKLRCRKRRGRLDFQELHEHLGEGLQRQMLRGDRRVRKFCFTPVQNHHPAQGAEAAEHMLPQLKNALQPDLMP